DPLAIGLRRGKPAGDVTQSHVGDGGVKDLHEGRDHHGDRHQPGAGGSRGRGDHGVFSTSTVDNGFFSDSTGDDGSFSDSTGDKRCRNLPASGPVAGSRRRTVGVTDRPMKSGSFSGS